jgi:hypothetical protein
VYVFPWIFFFTVILSPFVIGFAFSVRAARRMGKADRAIRTLAARPGWQLLERGTDGAEWAGYAGHFPWLLGTQLRTTAAGPLGDHRVTVARLIKHVSSRTDAHWLVVHFELPGDTPSLRLERHWSAAHLDLRFDRKVPYLAMSADLEATTGRFYASDLPARLAKLAAPAVSFTGDQACFVHHPLPEVVDMDELLKGLAALLPDLATLARVAPRQEEGDTV